MSNFKFLPSRTAELKPRIVVFGVGGAGGNAVNNMIEAGLEGVEFVVANTDAQQLAFSKTERRIQLGVEVTQGLGAGAHPEVGMSAAEESNGEIGEHLEGAHMVFITAGMGGGTGTGAAPVIARAARERGILTVGVVTKPFHFEGRHRMRLADAGIAELQRYVDTLIVIPNQNLFRIANERTTFAEAFGMADQVLHSGVRSITDLMVLPGLINLDFADVRTVMTEMGKAMMGTGDATGEGRALMAAQNAIQNPLLDEVSLKGARAVLVNVTGGLDMTLLEVDEACNAISEQVDDDANIIFGAAFDPSLEGTIRVAVVATGMDAVSIQAIQSPARPAAAPVQQPVHQAPSTFERSEVRQSPAMFQGEVTSSPARYGETPSVAAPVPEARDSYRMEPVAPLTPREDQAAMAFEEAETPVAPVIVRPQVSPPRFEAPTPVAPPVNRVIDGEPLAVRAGSTNETSKRPANVGWGSIFGSGGRRAPEATQPTPRIVPPPSEPIRAAEPIAPVVQASSPQTAPTDMEDLEIPSFLRRLAN
jgi:cell division protein FtsZ